MANLVSAFRTLLAFGVLAMLWWPTQTVYLWAFGLTTAVIVLDGVDGWVARTFNESSKAGALIDILGDRIVEQAYWIVFAVLGWVPVWVPLVVMTRGILVDGLRSLALEEGFTAFGQTSMMQSKLGVLLVSSRASRWLYAACKAVAFAFVILAHTPDFPADVRLTVTAIAVTAVYGSVIFCVLRGLPVLMEGKRFLGTASS
ncbi:MAG: CDP-alcohol phosphatidyltransferase family protein [Candidatus Melainabacteria bacterium]